MENVIRIGIDTSKRIFQLHGVAAAEQAVLRKRLERRQMIPFFQKLAPIRIGMEACGGSHYWARELTALGHEVVLLPAQHVKPYVRRGKHDAADAEAICEAMSRPRSRFVPVKTVDQQAAQMLVGVRDQLLRRRTQVSNAIRGYAAEFGLTVRAGLANIEPLLKRIAAENSVPAMAKELFDILAQEYRASDLRVIEAERKLMALHRADEMSKRLAQVPTIGPVGATLLSIKVADARAFRCGRDFAAWIGLTPKNHSTAGKNRLGTITRAGDEALRRTLVVGAMAVIQQVRRGRGKAPAWLSELLQRKHPSLVAVALANKTARIAWKLMVSGETYRHPDPNSFAPCSAPSSPLRAAPGGGLRPGLTAPAPGAQH